MIKRKICVVTGSRADYGLLFRTMKQIQVDADLELQVAVTGMHLSSEFGGTFKQIEQDGFKIDAKIDVDLSDDSPIGISRAVSQGVIGFAETLSALKPDIVLVLGDRYEIFAAVQAAMIARIPLAHIHGGETTQGAIDEAMRHSITKMSHFHFVAAEEYRHRVLQLGESPEMVVTVGAPGLENMSKTKLLTKSELEQNLKFKFGDVNFLVTYHPVTLGKNGSESSFSELLKALDLFPSAKIIFTKPNADTEGKIIASMIDNYVHRNSSRNLSATSMGQKKYWSTMKCVDVVIGNSSSGIIEAPVMKIPTVNIGDRQKGRLCATSIINSRETYEEISTAIHGALSADFKRIVQISASPYKMAHTSEMIKSFLKTVVLDRVLLKTFNDFDPQVK